MDEKERNQWMEQNQKLYHYYVWHFINRNPDVDPDEIASAVGIAFTRALIAYDPERGTINALAARAVANEVRYVRQKETKRRNVESVLSLNADASDTSGATKDFNGNATLAESFPDESVNVAEEVENAALINIFISFLDDPLITNGERDAIYKHFILDMSCAEIADEIGVTRQAVHQRIKRATEKCKTIFERQNAKLKTKEGQE